MEFLIEKRCVEGIPLRFRRGRYAVPRGFAVVTSPPGVHQCPVTRSRHQPAAKKQRIAGRWPGRRLARPRQLLQQVIVRLFDARWLVGCLCETRNTQFTNCRY